MANPDLHNALNDCIDQLALGRSIEEAVRRHPQFAQTLRPMLEAGLLARRAQVTPFELQTAQTRVRARVLAELQREQRRAPFVLPRLLPLAAALLLVFALLFTGTAAAEGSLPGDPLYGLKRLTEQVRLSLTNDDALREAFAARRIDEIGRVLAEGRLVEVDFQGQVQSIDGTNWRVAGVNVTLAADASVSVNARTGSRVEVRARTTAARTLSAFSIRLLDDANVDTPLPSPTVAPSATPTLTPIATATAQPMNTSVPAPVVTAELIQTPTVPASATFIPTRTLSVIVTPEVMPPLSDDDDDSDNRGSGSQNSGSSDNSGSGSDDDDSDNEDESGGGSDNSGSGSDDDDDSP